MPPDRDVIVMVGDGSYLMHDTELVTAVAEGIKIIVVLLQNHGYASIGHLEETVGSQRFGTLYRYLDRKQLDFQGEQRLPVDLPANARSYGVEVIEVAPGPTAVADLTSAVRTAKASGHSTVIHINSDPLVYVTEQLVSRERRLHGSGCGARQPSTGRCSSRQAGRHER